MTAYVTLRAVREGRLTLDTRLKVSAAAAAQQPVKMGFPVGTLVTVDNALKMMMVRSSNDMAVVLAEGVAGSIEAFSGRDERDRAPARHGAVELRQSERPAGRRADHLGARSRHPGARADPRVPRIRLLLAHPGDQVRQAGDAQLQLADRPLSGRRRHEDRLHLRLRLQSGRVRDPRRQAADRGRAGRIVVAGARHEGRAAARARLQQHRRHRLADAVARHASTRCSRSTRSRPTCARTCAARTASAARPRTRTRRSAPTRTRIRPTRCSWRACARKPRARRSVPRIGARRSRSWSTPARRASPAIRRRSTADIKPKKRKPRPTAKATADAKTTPSRGTKPDDRQT